jgi:hypothetical protein
VFRPIEQLGKSETVSPPLTMDEAARELRVSRRWLQDFLHAHPEVRYLRKGRRKLFDELALDAIREAMRRPIEPPLGKRGARVAAKRPSADLAEALRLASAGRRPRR